MYFPQQNIAGDSYNMDSGAIKREVQGGDWYYDNKEYPT